MGTRGLLKKVEGQLIRDLVVTTLTFERIGEKYGVTKQAIFSFCDKRGIRRPTRPKMQKPEHTEMKCSICQGLLRIAKKPRSDFICRETLRGRLGFQGRELSPHLAFLRKKGLVSQKFGRLLSKRAELAYQIYFRKTLPVEVIGKQAGLRNFHSLIQRHRASGWNVPPPLFTYDENERRKRGRAQPWAK